MEGLQKLNRCDICGRPTRNPKKLRSGNFCIFCYGRLRMKSAKLRNFRKIPIGA